MKIQICGFSGSGKSTFSRNLAKIYQIPLLHLDQIHFTSNWHEVENEEMIKKVDKFLTNESWIIDGNYTLISPKRYDECDILFYFKFNRINCLFNVINRQKQNKNKVRIDMADGCIEKLDREFLKWILYKGRSKKQKDRLKHYQNIYKDKLVIFKNRKDVQKYLKLYLNKNDNS